MKLSRNKMNRKSSFFIANISKYFIYFLILVLVMTGYHSSSAQQKQIMVRISEIEIDSAYLEDYISILKEEAAASVKLEPGVICIFPMYQKGNPTQIRILEMYSNKKSYEQHLNTAHFKKYKTST